MYKYAQLDSSNTPEARAHNEAIFASGPVWGLEVTNKEWAARCEAVIGNQHGEGKAPNLAGYGLLDDRAFTDPTKAACEVALTIPLPPAGTTLLFDRVDLDAVCAAAIFAARAEYRDTFGAALRHGLCVSPKGETSPAVTARMAVVAEADNFAVGKTPWQPYPLPTRENPWPAIGSVDSRRELAAINRAITDRSVTLETRVEWAKQWLLTGEEPEKTPLQYPDHGPLAEVRDTYRAEVERERQEIVTALERGITQISGDVINIAEYRPASDDLRGGDYISDLSVAVAVIAMPGKAFPGATGLALGLAPVGICVAKQMPDGKGGTYRKITICSWGVLAPEQLAGIRDRLNELEPIWQLKTFDGFILDSGLTLEAAQEANDPSDHVGLRDPEMMEGGPAWGGNLQSGILGSPQGRSTKISVGQIIDAIKSVI